MKGLSPKAQNILTVLSQDECRKSGGTEVLPEHAMLALLKAADSSAYEILKVLNVNVLSYQLALEQSLSPRQAYNPYNFSELPPSRRIKTLLDIAVIESRSLRSEYVGTEHILLAAVREENSTTAKFCFRTK